MDKLFLVKWANLSYSDNTWEKESVIRLPSKIQDFRIFNKALDKVKGLCRSRGRSSWSRARDINCY